MFLKKFQSHITILLIFVTLGLSAQTTTPSVTELFKNSKAFYSKQPVFKCDLTYTLFRNKQNPIIIEKYTGFMAKNGTKMYSKINQTEFLLVGNEYIKVNHLQKAIEYVKGNSANMGNPLEIEQYLKYFATQKVYDDHKYWRCELSTPKLTQLPYGSIIFYFSKKDFSINKQVLELVSPGSIKDENGKLTPDRKYLRIDVENFESPNTLKKNYFQISDFVVHQGSSVKVSPNLNSYKMIDRSTN